MTGDIDFNKAEWIALHWRTLLRFTFCTALGENLLHQKSMQKYLRTLNKCVNQIVSVLRRPIWYHSSGNMSYSPLLSFSFLTLFLSSVHEVLCKIVKLGKS